MTWKKAWHSFLVVFGFILSPLSWWNDLFVNIPLAYVFAIPFSLIKKDFFLPAFVIGYLLTNVLGMLLIHHGLLKIFNTKKKKKQLIKDLWIALAYTALIVALVLLGIITPPQEYFK